MKKKKLVYCRNCQHYGRPRIVKRKGMLHGFRIERKKFISEKCALPKGSKKKYMPSYQNMENDCQTYKRIWWYFGLLI